MALSRPVLFVKPGKKEFTTNIFYTYGLFLEWNKAV